jgi:hypothetical protein
LRRHEERERDGRDEGTDDVDAVAKPHEHVHRARDDADDANLMASKLMELPAFYRVEL